MSDTPMFVVQKRKAGEVREYCIVPNSAVENIICKGPAEFEVQMVADRLNDILAEAIAEVVFNCANCQGEVV